MSLRSALKRVYFLASMRWHLWRERGWALARRAAVGAAKLAAGIVLGTVGVEVLEDRGILRLEPPPAAAPAPRIQAARRPSRNDAELERRRAALADSSRLVVAEGGGPVSARMAQRPAPGTRALVLEEGLAGAPEAPASERALVPRKPRLFVRAKTFFEMAASALTGRDRIDDSRPDGALRRFDGLPFGKTGAPEEPLKEERRRKAERRRARTDPTRGPPPGREAPYGADDPLSVRIQPSGRYAEPLLKDRPGGGESDAARLRRLALERAEARRAYWLAMARRLGAGAALSLAVMGLAFILSGLWAAFRPWQGGRD